VPVLNKKNTKPLLLMKPETYSCAFACDRTDKRMWFDFTQNNNYRGCALFHARAVC